MTEANKRSSDPAGIFSDFPTNRGCLESCTIPFCRILPDELHARILQILFQANYPEGRIEQDLRLFSLTEINYLLTNNHLEKFNQTKLSKILRDIYTSSGILLSIHPWTNINQEPHNSIRFCFNPALLPIIRNSLYNYTRFSLLCPFGVNETVFKLVDYLAAVSSAKLPDIQFYLQLSLSLTYDTLKFVENLRLVTKESGMGNDNIWMLNRDHFLVNNFMVQPLVGGKVCD